MKVKRPRGLYRSRRGVILGVCRGLAEYFDLSVKWVRVGAVAACVFTGLWPAVLVYVLMALIMKPEPVVYFGGTGDDDGSYQEYASDRAAAIGRLNRTYQRLERRLRRLEDVVTSRDFSWQQRAGR